MKTKYLRFLIVLFGLSFTCLSAEDKKETDADNTDRNKKDQPGKSLTPIDQSNDPEDIKLVAAIRQLVVKDESLSSTAKNCKIITAQGQVTLRGPVNSAQEKATIEAHATKSAGQGKVHSELEVKSSS